MNTKSIGAALRNHCRAMKECGKMTSHKSREALQRANAQTMAHDSDAPGQVRHVLMDYRNSNERLAVLIMDRRKAYGLNERLRNSGLGFNVVTGY